MKTKSREVKMRKNEKVLTPIKISSFKDVKILDWQARTTTYSIHDLEQTIFYRDKILTTEDHNYQVIETNCQFYQRLVIITLKILIL